ncbi:exonuclease domain-containing protein [Corynebacterium flavescens]|uniref:exonuclease domain-containing protein n=1 Tax=Corynebacterium flavescens TaxID=28028 RepID=UPI0028A1D7CF|nr:exonuclease domain-containing protein [Corynebacterium flavescens]
MNPISLPFPFAVVDVETTGFGHGDRVIEIAIIACDGNGEEVERFESLIQPDRDIANSNIHGITATMVEDAPQFAEISSRVARLLSGRTVVAHNASFDARMIAQEFARCGVELPPAKQWTIDTMTWSRRLLPGSPGKLSAALECLGIKNSQAHAAMGDTEATARLFLELVRKGAEISAHPLPNLSTGSSVTTHTDHNLLPRPVLTGQRESDAYQELLIRVLDDEIVTEVERAQLRDAAQRLGLGAEEAQEVHVGMLQRMALVAWADGVLTKDERARIEDAAHALEVDSEEISSFLEQPVGPQISLVPGGRIVFSGELALPRSQWEQRIFRLGLSTGGVTKSTVALVAADPHSHSGKAKKARAYGIPMISETELAWLLRNYERKARLTQLPSATDAAQREFSRIPKRAVDSLESVFPWAWPREEDSEITALVLANEWILHRPDTPLHELSPRLSEHDAIDSLDRSRRAVQRWFDSFSQPLQACVRDLKDIRGMGPKSISDAVNAVALAALDAEDVTPATATFTGSNADSADETTSEKTPPATESTNIQRTAKGIPQVPAFSFALEQDPYNIEPLETPDLPRAAAHPGESTQQNLLAKVTPILSWFAVTGTPIISNPDLLPEQVRSSLEAFSDLSKDIRFEEAESAVSNLHRIWEDDTRCEDIFVTRIAAEQPHSLEEIGNRWGITRERVRQLEKAVREQAMAATAMHRAALPVIVPQAMPSEQFFDAHPEFAIDIIPGLSLGDAVFNMQTQVLRREKWVYNLEAVTAVESLSTDEFGVLDLAALNQLGPADSADKLEWLRVICPQWVIYGDHILTHTSRVSDRAIAVLSIKHHPMSAHELANSIDHANPRSLDNALARDERVHRVARGSWALKVWGGQEYRSVADWIGSRVDATGSYPLAGLLNQAPELGIAASSVRSYATSGEFLVENGLVKRNTEQVEIDADPQEAPDLYYLDGDWQLLLTINADHLRGSGFAVPRALLSLFDIPFLERKSFSSALGPQELISGRSNAHTGSIRRFLHELNIHEGNRVWLQFSADGTFSVLPATDRIPDTGLADVLNFCGLDEKGRDLAAVNRALGLEPDAPRRRTVALFNHRRQEEIAQLVREI